MQNPDKYALLEQELKDLKRPSKHSQMVDDKKVVWSFLYNIGLFLHQFLIYDMHSEVKHCDKTLFIMFKLDLNCEVFVLSEWKWEIWKYRAIN